MKSSRFIIISLLFIHFSCKQKNETYESNNDNILSYDTSVASEIVSEPISNEYSSSNQNNNLPKESIFEALDKIADKKKEQDNNSYNSESIKTNETEYSYDISGTDSYGNFVTGSVYMKGKYGYGTVEDNSGNEKDIDVEWTGSGTLEGSDDDGNTYDLETN